VPEVALETGQLVGIVGTGVVLLVMAILVELFSVLLVARLIMLLVLLAVLIAGSI